ncbi:MAG: PLDc N-terminal domain-containing protein [Nitrospirae bacterium]|nr:PLDc N-terminal domain-containing protein [Candidatus Manganitrophaceae bacterium]
MVVLVSLLVSLGCSFYLWRAARNVSEKLFWTIIIFVPILGPVFFAGFFNPPPMQPPKLRAGENRYPSSGGTSSGGCGGGPSSCS